MRFAFLLSMVLVLGSAQGVRAEESETIEDLSKCPVVTVVDRGLTLSNKQNKKLVKRISVEKVAKETVKTVAQNINQ